MIQCFSSFRFLVILIPGGFSPCGSENFNRELALSPMSLMDLCLMCVCFCQAAMVPPNVAFTLTMNLQGLAAIFGSFLVLGARFCVFYHPKDLEGRLLQVWHWFPHLRMQKFKAFT